MKTLLLLLIIASFLNCSNSADKELENNSQIAQSENLNQSENDSLIAAYFENKSHRWKDGRYLKYFCEGENLFIEYGNDKFKKVLFDTFLCIAPGFRLPDLWKENEDFLILSFSCGSPCWGVYVLPMNSEDTAKQLMYHFDFDSDNNILINGDYDESTEEYSIYVNYLKSKKVERIELEDCGAAFTGYCIDSVSVKEGNLFIQTRKANQKPGEEGKLIIRKKLDI